MWQHPNPYLINIVAIWMVVEVLNQEFAYATKRATREVALCCGERGTEHPVIIRYHAFQNAL